MFGFGQPKRKPISEAWDEQMSVSPSRTGSDVKRKPISQAFDEFSKSSKALPYREFVNRDIQKPQQSEVIQLKPEAETLPERKPSLGETLKSSFLGFTKSGEETIARAGTALKYAGKANQVSGQRTFLDKAIDPFSLGETSFGRAVKSSVGRIEESIGSKMEDVYGKSAEYYGSRPGYKPELSSFRDEATGKVSLDKLTDPRRLLQVFAEGSASFIPGAVVGATTKNPLAAGAVMGIVEAGDAAQSYAEEIAKNTGKSIEDLSDSDVKKIDEMATYYGIASAALESIFPAQLKRIIGEGGKEAEKNLLKRIFLKAPVEALRAVANEGGTEGVQRFAQNVIARASGINPNQQLTEGVLDEAIAGAVSGVGISTATSILSPGGSGDESIPVAPVEGKAPETPEEAPKTTGDTSDTTLTKYEAKKNVRSLFSALENDDMESVQEISSKMSKKELTDFRSSFEDMQIDEEVASNPDVLDKVSRDIETLNALIEEKKSKITQEAKNIVEGKPAEETLHVSDANAVKGIVEQVKQAVDEETKAKIDESVSKMDTGTLPGVSEARALENESNPFREISEFEALNESYSEKSGELSNKEFELKEKKKEMLAQKKLAQSREEKASIQKSIDDLDSERRDVEAKLGVIEEQGRSHALVLAQNVVDKIKSIEPNFDVAKSVDDNWELEDYTSYYEGIKQSKKEPYAEPKPKRRAVSRIEPVAERKPELPSEGANKYAEEAGRDTGGDGSVAGERPSDGRELKTTTVKEYTGTFAGQVPIEIMERNFKRNIPISEIWKRDEVKKNNDEPKEKKQEIDVVKSLIEKGIRPEKAEVIKKMFDAILGAGNHSDEEKRKAIQWLSSERANPFSRRVFEEFTGKKLPKTQKDSTRALEEMAGLAPLSKKWLTKSEVEDFVLSHIGKYVVIDDNKSDWKNGRIVHTSNPELVKLKEIEDNWVVYTKGKFEFSRQLSAIRDFVFEGKSVIGDAKNEEYSASLFKEEKPKFSKDEIEKLALSKESFTEEEKETLDKYEGAGATRESGRGILDEFFTPEKVAEKVWDIVSTYLPKKGGVLSVLEPSVGTGRFIKVAPENTKFRAYETNKVSAKITEKLYKNAVVSNEPFESIFIDEKGKKKAFEPKYDVVVGNPPYGSHRGKYKGIGEEPKIGKYEEYFLKRSLDLTKEGGIVAMVVPSGFLRSGNDYAKKAISRLGQIVDAYRLPNKIFKGTDVGTDIVIFEKKTTDDTGEILRSIEISDNKFFRAPMNSHKILGTKTLKKGRFGMEEFIEGNIETALSKIAVDRAYALETVSDEVESNTEKMEEERSLTKDTQLFDVFEEFFGDDGIKLAQSIEKETEGVIQEKQKEDSSWQEDILNEVREEADTAFQNSDMEEGYRKFVSIFKSQKMRSAKIKDTISAGDFETMKKEVSSIGIMRAVDFSNLFYSDDKSESEVFEMFRDRLKKEAADVLYGKRVAKNLGLVKDEAVKEGVKAELRPMKRTVNEEKDNISRDKDRPYVLISTKKGGTQIIEQFEASEEERYLYENTLEDGSIDPRADFDKESANLFKGKYYTEINYASGDIYKKLSALESEKDKMSEKQYNRQKSLLESVLPKRMVIQDISIVPISEMAKMSLGGVSLVDRFSEWLKTLPFDAFEGSNKYQIAGYLNGEPVNVGDKARNREIRKQRRDIGNKLFQKFYKEELPKEFQDMFEERFNKENNSIHTPNYAEYPFSTQLSKTFGGKTLSLRPIQMEGASFLVNKGVGMLAYEVGVGKTLSAIAAISEVMRRGWTKNPLIVVPKNLRSKWIREIADSIPGVKINDLGNLGADLKFKGDMKDFSIDENSLSIITEEGFKRIGFGEETFESLTRDLQDVTYEKGKKSARAQASADVKAEETVGKARRGTEFPLTFEELGFDHITFDEAHREKNVFAKAQASKGDRKANEYGAVRGAVSERGLKTYLATQYILKKNKGRNVFLLTATPFNNSPVEIYSMISLVAKKRLEDMGIKNINDFISLFIQLETRLAFKADGQYKETDQVRKFQNLRQLQLLVREYIDFRTGEEAGIPRPTKIRKKQFVKMNEMQWNAVKGAQVLFEDKDAGVLKAITELQKITLSPYLSRFSNASMASVSPKEFIEKSPKIKYTVEAIKKVHKANPKAGQIVFVEKGVEVFTPMLQHFVKDLKYKPNEVAIMDGSVAEARRDEIKEKFQNGEIKILMTTIKEGVDLQRTSTDLYNLYLPWNPTDLVQIEGRTWRQGSIYDKVRIHYPLLENSVDVFMFQKLEEKAARLASVFSYKGNELDVSDIDFEAMKIDLITDPALRAEAEYSLRLTKIENEISRVKSEKAFIEKKAGKIAEINEEISDYTKKVETYSGYGDSYKDVVASYDRKRSSLKEDLAKEIDRLRKNGVDVDEITRKVNEKDQELLATTSEREGLLSEKEKKISEAKKAPAKEVYGDTNFDELTEGMDEAGFFVEMPSAFYNRATRGENGKFTGSTPAHPDTISNKEIKTYLKSERARELVRKIKEETNPALRSVLQYRIARELASYDGDSKFEALGYFTPQRMEVSMSLAQSEEHFEKVLRHEIRHAAFVLLPREKQILIENWYKKLYQEKDHRELINIFGGKPGDFGNYEKMSKSGGIFEWDGITPVDPITFMADEAFNRFMDYRGERTSLQKMMDKMILAIYRLLSRINAAIFSEMRDRKELDILYDKVFSQKENAFDVPAEMMLMLRDKFIIPGRRISFYQKEIVSGGNAFAKDLFGEQTPERQEKRRIYMRAFEKVLAEKRPPSLGKMVDEAFAVKERRTMITAEKLQTLSEAVEDLAMTEGMQAGYLEGETSAVLAREEEIKTLQTKLESVEHIKDQAEAVKEELNEKSYDRLKALMSLQRKMERQATRYKEQKESLLKRFSEKKLEMKEQAKQDVKETKQKYEKRMRELQAIREEMYAYVKEHLPRKNWDKYLRFIRDAKTRENLQKLFESVDEDVKKIQRSAVISKIKKILGKAEDLPIQYQMMVKKITEDIDWGNMLPSTKEKLKKINEYLEKNPEAETSMSFRILKRLKILSKQSYKTLSTEQLLALSAKLELIQHVGRIAKSQNKANMAKGRADKLALLQKMSTNFDIFKQSGLTREDKERITFWEKSLNTLQSTEFQLMPMDFFFYILDGKQEMGTNYQLIKKPIDEAFSGYWKQSNEIKESLSKFIDKLKLEGLEFTDTMWDRIGIHAIRAQKGGTAKLLGSGYEQSAIDDVVLNEKELAMYGYMRQELDKMFPAIKEVYARVHNIELEGVDEYFPFLMDWSNRKPVYSELEEQYNNKKGVSGSGFTIKRVGGSNPVRVHALEAFLKHVDQATYFISLEEAVRSVHGIIEDRRYREAVGEKAQAYTMRWLEVIERHGVPENDKQVAFFDALRRNITLGTLAFKLTTIPIQFGAIFNGASMIGKSAFSGFGEIVTSKEAREFVLEASEQIKMRVGDAPEFIEDVPTERKGAIGRKVAKGLNVSREYGMWAIKKADYYTAAGTWLGAYKKHLKLSGQEFDMQNVDQEARAYADMVVRMTQGSNEFKDMPPLLSQKYRTFGKLLLQFQNFSLFQWNFARQVVGKNISTDKSKAAWQATMIFANVMFAMQIRALISRGIWGAPPDDEESRIAAILWELTQQIPLLGSQFYNLEQFLKNPTYYAAGSWETGIVAVDTTVEAVQSIPKVFAEQKEETRKKSAVKAAESVGTLLGVPSSSQMSQIWRSFLTK